MSRSRLEPFFIDGSAGRIFLLLRAPEKAQRCVLFVPPFAEEMNKVRRQIAVTAQSLVENGYAVLLYDLSGTGDSEGDFSTARWDVWKEDTVAAVRWAESAGLEVAALVATRLGCALAAQSLEGAKHAVGRTVFWQPVRSGRRYMTQFLRLRVAAAMMESGVGETVEDLRARMCRGETLEIAGYGLSPELWRSVEAVDLDSSLSSFLGKLQIIEIGAGDDGALSVGGKRLADAAVERRIMVEGKRVPGEPFWAATEIVTNSELSDLTLAFLADRPVL